MNPLLTRRNFAICCGFAATSAAMFSVSKSVWADDAVTGEWTLHASDRPGQVYFSLAGNSSRGTFSTSSDWNLRDFAGLDLAAAGKHDVRFTINREAGRFDAEGVANDGAAAGLFRFTPAPAFAAAMAAAGFAGATPDRQLSFALHDVSVAFAREMKGAGLEGLDLNTLMAFRIHRVDLTYINAMRAEGMTTVNAESWIAFGIHGATPEFVKALHALGYTPDDRQLVTLRIHQVTPEYIAGLKSHGLASLTLEKIVSLKIHGIG